VTRRGRNEGSIDERADGTWEAKISLGYDATGKRARKSLYGKTRADVRQKMERELAKFRHGVHVAERRKLGEYLSMLQTQSTPYPSALDGR
jgi:hypothetical protein